MCVGCEFLSLSFSAQHALCLLVLCLLGATTLLFTVHRWSSGPAVFSATSRDRTLPQAGKAGAVVVQEVGAASIPIADPSDTPPEPAAERYMIYDCKSYCGGWADRLKGIVFAYVIATLTNRTFGIRITDNPCPLTDFVRPNEVNWSLPETVDLESGARAYRRLDSVGFYKSVATSDLEDLFPSRVALLTANLDYFDQIKANERYRKQLEWMMPLSRDRIFSRIYRKLFRFSPSVQRAVDRALSSARPSQDSSGRLVCAHLRFAANSETLRDSVKRHTNAHGDTLLTFLQKFDPSSPNYDEVEARNAFPDTTTSSAAVAAAEASPRARTSPGEHVRFFVASDSRRFSERASELFGDRFVRTEGEVVHVDKPGKDRRAACEGFTKVLADQHLLSTCDVLVLSKSGLGRQAAYLRGTDRGLFCLLMDGSLRKCSASRLRELYGVLG